MDAKKAITKLEGRGYKVRAYSGRAMSGRYCVGVTVDRHDVLEAKKVLRGARVDAMGMGAIVYWPHIAWRWDKDYETALTELREASE